MKKTISIITASLMMGSIVQAGIKPYAELKGGVALLQDSDWTYKGSTGTESGSISYKGGYAIGGVIGLGFDKIPVRTELEFFYQMNELDTFTEGGTEEAANGDFSAMGGMINGYFDLTNKSPLTPYLMAGIGISKLEWKFDGDSTDNDHVFTGQVGAGAAYEVIDNLSLNLQYRLRTSTKATFPGGNNGEGEIEIEYLTHLVELGVRYRF